MNKMHTGTALGLIFCLLLLNSAWSDQPAKNEDVYNLTWPVEWTVFGPLERSDPLLKEEMLKTIPAEINVGGKIIQGKKVTALENKLDFGRVFGGQREGKTAYAFAKIVAGTNMETSVGASADWWMQWWLDGKPVYDTLPGGNSFYPYSIQDHVFKIKLKKGEHVLAARVISGSGSFILMSGGPRELRASGMLLDKMPPDIDEFISKIPGNHPRLFINAGILADIKTNMTPLQKTYFESLVKRVDLYPLKPEINTNDVDRDSSQNDHGKQAANAALVYLLTGEKKYFEKAVNLLKASVDYYVFQYNNNRAVSWYSQSRIGALCAFDWLYNDLSGEQRKNLGAPLLEHILQALDTKKTRSLTAGKPEGSSGSTAGFYGNPNLSWYAGLAFLGAGLNDDAALELLKKGYQDHLIMFRYRSDAPSPTACIAYAIDDAYKQQECNFFYTWRAAGGDDFAPNFPRLAFYPNWLLWNCLPGSDGRILEFGFGDTWHFNSGVTLPRGYLAQVAAFYREISPEMLKMTEFLLAKTKTSADPDGIYRLFLGGGQTQSVVPFLFTPMTANSREDDLTAGLPYGCHFSVLGQTFMHSGWDEDDTYCLFTAGSPRAGHKHYDENNFVIYHGGYLALDTGTRVGYTGYLDHQANYYGRTVAHNCITIRMEGEVFPGGSTNCPVNDGGMNPSTIGGKVLAFETNERYTYVAADAAGAYNTNKCSKVLRQFVFVYPDYFVIFDRVISKKPEYRKTWMLHTQNEPAIKDDTFSAEHWDGKLWCRTLLPSSHQMTGIGGNDKEFWCDGRNWPISSNRLGEVRSGDLYGRWRVEVTPAENRQETIFLHFIQVGGKALKTMTASSLLEDDKQAGVKFHAGNETITVLFNKCDPVGGKITIKRGWWKNIVDQCVLAGGKIDLKGGWWKSNIMDQSLSDKIQAQSDTASRTGRASYEKPKWVEMKQDGKDLENNGVLTNFAPIQLRLADNNKINKAQIKITVNDEDIAGYSKISLGDDRRTADIRVDIKAYMDKAGSEPVKLDEKGAGVQSLGVKKLKISYLDPVSGGSVKFRQRFQKPSGKPAQSAVFVSDLKEDQYLAEKGSWKWFNKNKNYAGQPIMVGLNVYEKGLMLVPPEVPVFAPSETDPIAFVEYTVPPECRMKQFKTVIGIDQFRAVIGMSQNTKGTAMFRVKLADKDGGWILAYESPAISRDCDIIEIAIPLQNKARLRLESVGCSHLSAHAVWADARFE